MKNMLKMLDKLGGQGQEVEFHEIKINFFMRSNSWDQFFFHFS